ncbi:hypothetical protein [Celeribacter sp.]|uniref:hypothetical protein n=1 Tax=Celeribacter sp. TaxID=1890673 RepID=UPI003A92B007
MPRIVIHVGTHKTATTHIQDTLHKNRRLLRDHGVIYPSIGQQRGHHGLASAWIPLGNIYGYRNPARRWASLDQSYLRKRKDSETVIISSEEFSRWAPHRVDMAQLRELLSGFDEVRLICVVRTQPAFIQSVYQQVSSDRNPGEIAPYLEEANTRKRVEGLFTNYQQLLKHFYSGFAPEEVRLISYERAVKQENGILGAFLKTARVDFDPAMLVPFGDRNSNVSLEPLATLAANMVSKGHKAPPYLLRVAQASVTSHFGPNARTTLFTTEEVDRMAQLYEPMNRKLEKMVQPVQPKFRMPTVENAVAERITRDRMDGDFFETFARYIYHERHKGAEHG